LDGVVVTALLDGVRSPEPERNATGLSGREVEVLAWVARGKTNPEIGIILGISAKTIQHHVAHIYEKIGVSSRAGAALFAMENGLLRDPD
jgi:DNA-binding CsgD family transcriptional regulator